MGIIIYSFNLNLSPKISYGVLECDIVILQNYILKILYAFNKKALFVLDPILRHIHTLLGFGSVGFVFLENAD